MQVFNLSCNSVFFLFHLCAGVYTLGKGSSSLPFSLSHPVSLNTFRSACQDLVVASLKAEFKLTSKKCIFEETYVN